MKRYMNIDGDSNVIAYEYGANYISVQFFGGAVYTYTYASAGTDNVEKMKALADSGNGLNSFIMKNVRTKYASKR